MDRTIYQMRAIAEFRPTTVNLENRTIEVVFTTGQGGRKYDYYNDLEFIEELDVTPESVRTERLDKGLSVIDSHNVYEGIKGVFAITENYRFENGSLIGIVRFSSDKDSDVIFQKAVEGILRHVSLSYRVHKYLKTSDERDKLPTLRAIDWEPTELSFVPVSFENDNGVRAEQRSHGSTNTVEIEDKIMDTEDDKRSATPAPTPAPTPAATVTVTPATTLTPAATVTVTPAATATPAEIRAGERDRLKLMVDACDKAGIKPEFATRAFGEDISINSFRENVINELALSDSDNLIITPVLKSDNRSDQALTRIKDAELALSIRCGVTGIELSEGIRSYTGLTMMEMARQFLNDSNVNIIGMSRQKLAARAFHSTSDFPLILANVMNKNLQDAYQETPRTFLGLGRRTTATDFRDKNTYSLGDAPDLLPLGENGEYTSGTFSENGEKYGLATFARKIAFSRKMLINDDMSALDRMPAMFGAAGSRLESDLVWGLILNFDFAKNTASNIVMSDTKPLFHADHNNLIVGVSNGAMDETGLSNMRKQGRKQLTLDGKFMNITWSDIVVPEDLETAAEKVLFNSFVAATSATTNPFLNTLGLRVEPRLGVISQKAWYAFSKVVDTFEYAFLAGEEEMFTEVNQSTNVDGLEVLVRKDFGAGLIDFRGFGKATGEA